MTKEKICFNAGEMIKAANRLEERAQGDLDNAKALRMLGESKAVAEQLESTVEALKGKIDRNLKVFKDSEDKVKGINGVVQDAELKAEGAIAKIHDNVKTEESNARNRIKDVYDSEKERVMEAVTASNETIKDSNKKAKDAQQKANTAIAAKDQIEAALNSLKVKVGGINNE